MIEDSKSMWSTMSLNVKLNYEIFKVLSDVKYTFRSTVVSTQDKIKIISFIPENLSETGKFKVFLRSIETKVSGDMSIIEYENPDDMNLNFLSRLVNTDGVIVTEVYSDNNGFHLYCKFPTCVRERLSDLIFEATGEIPGINIDHFSDMERYNPVFPIELDRAIYEIKIRKKILSNEDSAGRAESDNMRTDRIRLVGRFYGHLPSDIQIEKTLNSMAIYNLSGSLKEPLLKMVEQNILTYMREVELDGDGIILKILTPQANVRDIIRIFSDFMDDDLEIISIGERQTGFNQEETLKISK